MHSTFLSAQKYMQCADVNVMHSKLDGNAYCVFPPLTRNTALSVSVKRPVGYDAKDRASVTAHNKKQ